MHGACSVHSLRNETGSYRFFVVLPAKVRPYFGNFDYIDISYAQTVLLQLDDVAVVAVLNDSHAAWSVAREHVSRITGPLSPAQLREVAVRMAAINLHLKERPRFSSAFNLLAEEHWIHGYPREEFYLNDWNDDVLGQLMYHICGPVLPNNAEKPGILENIRSGTYTFLFRADGTFASDHGDEVSASLAE